MSDKCEFAGHLCEMLNFNSITHKVIGLQFLSSLLAIVNFRNTDTHKNTNWRY